MPWFNLIPLFSPVDNNVNPALLKPDDIRCFHIEGFNTWAVLCDGRWVPLSESQYLQLKTIVRQSVGKD